MTEQHKFDKLVSIGRCCKPLPNGADFHVFIQGSKGETFDVKVTAAELLSYRRFNAAMLTQRNFMLDHEADAGGKAGRLAWRTAIIAAMGVPHTGCV